MKPPGALAAKAPEADEVVERSTRAGTRPAAGAARTDC